MDDRTFHERNTYLYYLFKKLQILPQLSSYITLLLKSSLMTVVDYLVKDYDDGTPNPKGLSHKRTLIFNIPKSKPLIFLIASLWQLLLIETVLCLLDSGLALSVV